MLYLYLLFGFIFKIQRSFLWSGSEESRKIAWVSWEVVCRCKDDGGLGIQKLHAYNLALLRKWIWRLLTEREGLWHKVARVRYGGSRYWYNSIGNGEVDRKGSL